MKRTTRPKQLSRPKQYVRQMLSVASECVPLAKTGGLADVVGALPKALEPLGWHQRVLIPAYPGVLDSLDKPALAFDGGDLYGGHINVYRGTAGDIDVMAMDAPHLFSRAGSLYGYGGEAFGDNVERFAALSIIAARIAIDGAAGEYHPEVVHAHDWQAGWVPAYLKFWGNLVPSVFTIHNVAFQGNASPHLMGELQLPASEYNSESLEYYGQLSSLKAGLVHANKVTTVSPTYARELLSPQFGFGMEGVVASRGQDMSGIVNGIDTKVWDPAHDIHLKRHYHLGDMRGKAINRAHLLSEFGVPDSGGPVAVMVTRLTYQKGIDLVPGALGPLFDAGGTLLVLGSGDAEYEQRLQTLVAEHPGQVGLRLGYDEPLSHRMIAGGDVILVPSRFEPCGLTQLYGLRYGTVPVVAHTGGLADTVMDWDAAKYDGTPATGFVHTPNNTDSLRWALSRMSGVYHNRRQFSQLRRNGMSKDVSWQPSAVKYAALYESITNHRE